MMRIFAPLIECELVSIIILFIKYVMTMWHPWMVLTLLIISDSVKCHDPIIDTPCGKIIGKTEFFDNIPVSVFLGIPFVEPTLGNQRFKIAKPISPWTQPLTAKSMPPACIQYSPNPFPWLDDLPGHSEDCLYLNIWVPTNTTSSNKKSVMFFIHGGGFRISSSRLKYFDGRVLAAIGDVIVVTTNYRLGPLGFLYTGSEDAPGNMGLHDILASLKWIRSNIEYFGGDRESITLFGQSAGAITIGMFLTSPLASGLFRRAIMESGSAANLDGENNDKDSDLTRILAKAVGCADDVEPLTEEPKKVVNCLRGFNAINLTRQFSKINPNPQRGFYPRFGDQILPRNSRQSLINGNFLNIDLIVGANKNEGSIMETKVRRDIFGFFGQKDPEINKTFGEFIMKEDFKDFSDADAVIRQYLSNLKEDDYNKVRYEIQAASGDYARICPSVYLAETVARAGNKVFFYFFQHRPSNSPFAPWMGVVHFDETPFVFGYPLLNRQDYTEYEQKLSRLMVQSWTNFAKTGVPDMTWPLYSKENNEYKAFEQERNTIKNGPHLENCNFFRNYFGF